MNTDIAYPKYRKWEIIKSASGRLLLITHIDHFASYSSYTCIDLPKNKFLQKIVIIFHKLKNWWLAI
jgi:hypothetical protein